MSFYFLSLSIPFLTIEVNKSRRPSLEEQDLYAIAPKKWGFRKLKNSAAKASVPKTGREANLFHGLAAWHHLTGDWSRPSAFTIKALASLKSFGVAPDQYPVEQVALSQLPPSVIHSPVRNTSQVQIAFLGFDGSTVQRLLRHHVQGVPLEQVRTFLPCLNCSSENEEYTVRTPLASVLGWVVLQGGEDMLAPSSTSQKQIALAGSSGCEMQRADVQSAY
ncbi:MAG TPA: hypothetical protein VNE84_10240 [Candidatus Limnocylindria bacterium]|nr:hypothetical protein [Candidatus Limnocylindria bacterium]